jgi:hypothetical protein
MLLHVLRPRDDCGVDRIPQQKPTAATAQVVCVRRLVRQHPATLVVEQSASQATAAVKSPNKVNVTTANLPETLTLPHPAEPQTGGVRWLGEDRP